MTDAQKVSELMDALEHPLKAEIEAVRAILKNTNSKIAERVKWNSPSYYYRLIWRRFTFVTNNLCI